MYKKNENIVFRKIHGAYFLIDITDNYLDDVCALYEINEIGAFVWNHIHTTTGIREIVALLINEITDEVCYDDIYNDIFEFVELLHKNKFIKRL